MYHPNSQGRLQIPNELSNMLSTDIRNRICAICLSKEKNEIYIVPKENICSSDIVLTTRSISKKGRIFIKSISSFLGDSEEYLIYLRDEKIWIKGII